METASTRRRVLGARWSIRNRIGRHSIILPMTQLKERGSAVWMVAPDTRVCIDGFPRSATTFAVAAFQYAQPRPVRAAHHSHVPAQVVAATRRGLPTLVTIREPEEAVLSTAVYLPYVNVHRALAWYSTFYEHLLPHRDRFLVGRFDDISSDFGGVTRRLNERFGTGFAEYRRSAAADRTVFSIVDRGDERAPTNDLVTLYLSGCLGWDELNLRMAREHGVHIDDRSGFSELTVARPVAARLALKDALREEYRGPSLARLRARAERAHAELTAR
jgi:hypothetical protein